MDYSYKSTPKIIKDPDDVEFKAGEVIIKQGFPGDHAYIVKHGAVEVIYIENDMSETHLADLGIGEMFGETALLEDIPRTACVRAKTDVILQIMDVDPV